ncbi:MAG: hypothetical protein ACOH5I_00805 [Oligoflexus sp.]
MNVFATLLATTLGLTGTPYQQNNFHLSFRQFASPLPQRDHSAPQGSQFVAKIAQLSEGQSEQEILNAVLAGNIPDFLRTLVPVTITNQKTRYGVASITFWVMPDYLAVGSDRDYVRLPLNLHSADRIADAFNLRLPTRKMVDAIYHQANVKLRPRPMRPGPQMTSAQYYQRHHQMIEQDLSRLTPVAGQLIAGHKKDVVQSRKLLRKPGSIAIYGWHQSNKKPIQPLSTVHHAAYADYSHGIRMVANHVEIRYENRPTQNYSLDEVLQDPKLCRLLSDEGQLDRKQLKLHAASQGKEKRNS